jgi:Protein of unknown function (DUF2637)
VSARTPDPATPQVSFATLRTGVTITSLIGIATGYVSYTHALYVARLAGADGMVAYVVPLFADGLILLSSTALYAAAQAKVKRPPWATGGLALGIVVTVVMNVSAGAQHGPAGALVAALAPVVFLVSLEVLIWLFRMARGGHAPDTPGQCPHGVAGSVDEAVRMDWLHRRDCLGEDVTYVQHGARWGIDRRKVPELVAPAAPPDVAGPSIPPGGSSHPSLNGSGPHA